MELVSNNGHCYLLAAMWLLRAMRSTTPSLSLSLAQMYAYRRGATKQLAMAYVSAAAGSAPSRAPLLIAIAAVSIAVQRAWATRMATQRLSPGLITQVTDEVELVTLCVQGFVNAFAVVP